MIPIEINGAKYDIPTMLEEVKLYQFVEVNNMVTEYLSDIQDRLTELNGPEELDLHEQDEKAILENELVVKMSCVYFSYWTKIDYQVLLESMFLNTIMTTYLLGGFMLFQSPPEDMKLYAGGTPWSKFVLPEPKVEVHSPVTFGEMLDAKIAIQGYRDLDEGYWNSAKDLCLIFFRKKKEKYSIDLKDENGIRYKEFDNLPMHIVYAVISFFERINSLSLEFPLYFDSNLPSGQRVSAHMASFGWYNFLKSIANKKVFDVAGLNSIDSARAAKWYDVLLYASEEKLYSEANYLDEEEKARQNKNK